MSSPVDTEIAGLEARLNELEQERVRVERELGLLKVRRPVPPTQPLLLKSQARYLSEFAGLTSGSPGGQKLALFGRLFRGRLDVFTRRFTSSAGKAGYSPPCHNEWVRGVCGKNAPKKITCGQCLNQDFYPIDESFLYAHLTGVFEAAAKEYAATNYKAQDPTLGVYAMLQDETCWFLAADFDKADWQANVAAYRDAAVERGLPIAVERSRSGNGAHAWLFFEEPVPATDARRLGTLLLTQAMERRPDLSFEAYDRLFPNQDRMPIGGFGNLIALPLQLKPREDGNSLFVDEAFVPYPDQWAYLASVGVVSREEVIRIAGEAIATDLGTGVLRHAVDEEDPWAQPPSRRPILRPITDPLPEVLEVVRGAQVYVERTFLPPALIMRILRLASYHNPEFYSAQKMRYSTYDKPRIISIAELFPKYVAVPRGCFEELVALLEGLKIKVTVRDERSLGAPLKAPFLLELYDYQEPAFNALMAHDIGVLALATSFGKTVLAAKVICERGVNTLIIVNNEKGLEMWEGELPLLLGIEPKHIGVIQGGRKKPTGILDVALWQSLVSRKTGEVNDLVANYGHVVIDECHHVSAERFSAIAKEVKARYVLGLSATPKRKDGQHPILFMQCGPVRHVFTEKQLAAHRPFERIVVLRHTEFKSLKGAEVPGVVSIQQLYRELAQDAARNDMIVADIVAAMRAGKSPVVITERKDHLELLAERLSRCCKNIIVLKGGMGRKVAKAANAALLASREGEERLLLATGRYLGEGFNDARLDTLFLTLPISWSGTLAQYAGRLNRPHPDKKEVLIYDYADYQEPMLARMAQKRAAGYRKIGYTERAESATAMGHQGKLFSGELPRLAQRI